MAVRRERSFGCGGWGVGGGLRALLSLHETDFIGNTFRLALATTEDNI